MFELFVIGGDAIVDENERARNVAIDGVGVVGGKLFGLLIGCGIGGKRRLLELGFEGRRCDELDDALDWSGKENVEALDVSVPTI